MDGWTKRTLVEIIDLIGGGTPKTSRREYWNGDINWLSVKDFSDDNRYVYTTEKTITEEGLKNSSTKLLQKNDIIISARGTVGELAMIPFPMAFNQSCYGIRAKESVDSIFLYYLIKNSIRKLKAITHGSVFDTITRETFSNIYVDIPDANTQKQIAKILSVIDDRIENNYKINNNLENQLHLYYKMLFKENPKDNWKLGTLEDLGKIIGGGTPSKKVPQYYSCDGIPWITPKDLSKNQSKFIARGVTDISEEGLNNSSAVLMPKGSVLFSSRAPIGYIAIAKNKLSTNQGFKSIIPYENFGTALVYYFLKDNLQLIDSLSSGSTFNEVSTKTMKNIPALIPDIETVSEFRKYADKVLKLQEQFEEQIFKLNTIKEILSIKLLSGELDISNIDI